MVELTEEEKKKFNEILEFSKKYAEENGFKLNPDENKVKALIIGLIRNEEKYGYRYCPCRVVSGNPEEDKKIICPCVYHKEELEKMGRCWCGLFINPAIEPKEKIETEEWRSIWDNVNEKLKTKTTSDMPHNQKVKE